MKKTSCMPRLADISYDVASAMVRGEREIQEDALAADFRVGSEFGFVVLSDGMGGHAAGDVASNIVVTEVFSELKLRSGDLERTLDGISGILSAAAISANQCLREHVARDPDTTGMGATLVAPVLSGYRLHWISIGDSPLYLFREGALRQLNEDHSLAPQIDCMVKSGMISESDGRDHPDRNCLTSALLGDEIPLIDCPEQAFTLQHDDILIAASDGLQFLTDVRIQEILAEFRDKDSSEIAERLISGIEGLHDPYQDNVCFTVIKVVDHAAAGVRQALASPEPSKAPASPEPKKEAAEPEAPVPAMREKAAKPRRAWSSLLRGWMRVLNSGALR